MAEPLRNPQLDLARDAVRAAQIDTIVITHAPYSLELANEALAYAERAVYEGKSTHEVIHRAYVAQQRAAIAQSRARTRKSRTEAAVADARARLALLRGGQTDRGMVLTLEDVLFDVGKAVLRPEGVGLVDRLAQYLDERPGRSVLIEGHTDSTGGQAFNRSLSQRRAESVRARLILRGIDSRRVRAVGLGERFPVASNVNADGRQRNRRVEIVVSDQYGESGSRITRSAL